MRQSMEKPRPQVFSFMEKAWIRGTRFSWCDWLMCMQWLTVPSLRMRGPGEETTPEFCYNEKNWHSLKPSYTCDFIIVICKKHHWKYTYLILPTTIYHSPPLKQYPEWTYVVVVDFYVGWTRARAVWFCSWEWLLPCHQHGTKQYPLLLPLGAQPAAHGLRGTPSIHTPIEVGPPRPRTVPDLL